MRHRFEAPSPSPSGLGTWYGSHTSVQGAREHHLVQLHVGHTAATTREVLHDEGHIVFHLGNMIEKRRNLVTD